ncbi:MAG TPA: chemotaxis protein CheX [bacterium]|nr:chemotaxis protein CheX [bacterium]
MEAVQECKLPQTLLDGVKSAVIEVMESICGKASEHGECGAAELSCGVIGVISLIGQDAWSMMVGLPRGTAIAFAKQFTGDAVAYDSRDMGDVVGELANIIAGQAAGRMESAGLKASLSLPTVARGNGIAVPVQYELPSVCMGFTCPQGIFWVRIASAKRGPSGRFRPASSTCRS